MAVMTPLEAAKTLSVIYPLWKADDGEPYCIACQGMDELTPGGVDFVHQSDCPWLQIPAIVASLEAAERVAAAHERREARRSNDNDWSPAYSLGTYGELHREVRALVAALKGEAS